MGGIHARMRYRLDHGRNSVHQAYAADCGRYRVKPYTVSGNLICPDFTCGREIEPVTAKPIDAYEQLESEQPGELLYMTKGLVEPPSDVEH